MVCKRDNKFTLILLIYVHTVLKRQYRPHIISGEKNYVSIIKTHTNNAPDRKLNLKDFSHVQSCVKYINDILIKCYH